MDSLPPFAFEEIVLFLDPRTAFWSLSGVNSRCHTELHSPLLTNRYFASIFRIPTECRLPFTKFSEILAMSFRDEGEELSLVPITGFATTGGVDSGKMQYWVGNMFQEQSPKAYCSHDNKNNIVCAGVLTQLLPVMLTPMFEIAKREIASIVRSNEIARKILPRMATTAPDADLTPEEQFFCVNFFLRSPGAFYPPGLDMTQQERTALFSKLASLARIFSMTEIKLNDVLVAMDNPYLLELKIDKERISRENCYFWGKEFILSREGRYTCPVETFALFVSMDFVELNSEEFTKFSDIRESRDVQRIPGLEIVHSELKSDSIFHEFRLSSCRLRPFLWGKFLSREKGTLSAKLDQVITGKYFYVLLINPESRMAEMNDRHDFTNIDVKFAGMRGFVRKVD